MGILDIFTRQKKQPRQRNYAAAAKGGFLQIL